MPVSRLSTPAGGKLFLLAPCGEENASEYLIPLITSEGEVIRFQTAPDACKLYVAPRRDKVKPPDAVVHPEMMLILWDSHRM